MKTKPIQRKRKSPKLSLATRVLIIENQNSTLAQDVQVILKNLTTIQEFRESEVKRIWSRITALEERLASLLRACNTPSPVENRAANTENRVEGLARMIEAVKVETRNLKSSTDHMGTISNALQKRVTELESKLLAKEELQLKELIYKLARTV